jgi:ketosteroid isomerase-like protein
MSQGCSDPTGPPAARRPAEALELVCAAVSDGDLDAAVAQYECGAVLRPWADQDAWPGMTVQALLVRLMQLRLPLSLQVHQVLKLPDAALVLGTRRIAGRGPGREQVDLRGHGATVVRRHRGRSWRIAVDTWQLDDAS